MSETDFAAFVRERSASLFRTAYVLTGSRDAADDLVQEALERACRHWRKASAADSPEAYVRKILVNLANDRWRRLKRLELVRAVPDRADPGDAFGRVDSRSQLIQALLLLPMGQRTAVVLHYFHDMADTQIAATLGVSAGTARSQLSRGLAKLREALAPDAVPGGRR
ncbi:SigE family RNA polymerase sigma factor [Actinocorallia longicatena]|uniref:SigE family RNA polymerase sigma factor n=1 Tax=Actinocorallia longicatena TaxID=111803 RepID=A0ABP6QAQ9_9ACTN